MDHCKYNHPGHFDFKISAFDFVLHLLTFSKSQIVMDKVIIKRIPIKNAESQELDIDTDKMKEELQNAYPDFVYEHYSYSIQADQLQILFLFRQKKNTGTIGFTKR
jgi:hypothetical protein